MHKFLWISICLLFIPFTHDAQHSVARQWNEVLLYAIRNDFARPTVHARNLFHTSVALYDAWAIYDPLASPYFMGNRIGGYQCPWGAVGAVPDIRAAQEEAMSYAAYRLLSHRFGLSPDFDNTQARFDDMMSTLGFDINYTASDYANGSPADVGNYIAQCLIDFGRQDGANEDQEYLNRSYETVNDPLIPVEPGNPNIIDLNRWQPLTLDLFIDQSGNPIPFNTPEFLSPEWGQVTSFALTASDRTVYIREDEDNAEYWVYHDPGPPVQINTEDGSGETDLYQWGFSLVSVWSSHLDPADGVMWDISPASQGNIDLSQLPQSHEALNDFYHLLDGGDPGQGHAENPVTGEAYAPQIVPRGDYTRVLAEFWADGPDSETPPGHWFTILNYVNDHPQLEKRYRGEGPILDDLEWDVKSYLALGGAMHDAAITAWGIKGWYDYIRPISAIRAMADLGQSSDPALSNYSPGGLPLIPGYIEVVESGDALAGSNEEHVNKIKLLAWRGPEFIDDPETDKAGVGWILAENWWPYQRPSFITPPFAGYISGHSTYSRAAAEVLTLLTGDPFFPGGIGEFEAKANEFLVFEEGPSVDITLQWATYQDASDQTSLSRIWGGIHPPVDDIPGRLIGYQIGHDAFAKAERYFEGFVTDLDDFEAPLDFYSYPNPLSDGDMLMVSTPGNLSKGILELLDLQGQVLAHWVLQGGGDRKPIDLSGLAAGSGCYLLKLNTDEKVMVRKIWIE